jgi:hypothetical protein
MTTAIFKSSTVYYAGGFDDNFDTFKTTSQHEFNGGKD